MTSTPLMIAPRAVIRPAPLTRPAPANSGSATAVRFIGIGLAVLAILQLAATAAEPETFGLLRSTVSDLVYAPGGAVLFPVSGALTVAGGVVLTRTLRRRGLRAAGLVMGLWSAALAVSTIFPTDAPGVMDLSISAEIHRWAAAVMFAATPLIGWLVARHRAGRDRRVVTRRSWYCVVAGLGQLLCSLPSIAPGISTAPAYLALGDYRGMAERVLFVAIIVVLVSVARLTGETAIRGVNPTATASGRQQTGAMNIDDAAWPAGGPTDSRDSRQGGPSRRPDLTWYLTTSFLLSVTWPIGLALFIMWTVLSALSIFVFIVPLLRPLSAAIRSYAGVHRRYASRVLGVPVADLPPQPRGAGTLFGDLVAPLRDAATWRRWAWLIINSTLGFVLALIPVALAAGAILYTCYPLLYALTPHEVFGTVFGVYELQSVAEAWTVTPVGALFALLYWMTARPLARLNASVMAVMTSDHAVRLSL